MPVVGTLVVDLVANTATFTADLGKAGNSLDGFGKQAQGAGEAMDYSMREARGSLMLMEHELGFRLPREMNTLIASIPGIGLAFEALLPVMGVVFAGKMIYDFVEKNRAAQEALTKGWVSASESIATHSDELSVSIAESKLKIDQLLGKPTSGDNLALEIAKAKVEADKLAASLKKDLDGIIALLDKAAHGSLMTAITGTSGSGQAEDVAKGLRDELAKIPHDAKNYNELAAAATVAAWKRAQSEIEKNNKTHADQLAAQNLDPEQHGRKSAPTDFTAANIALQQFQEHLSEVHNELDLVGKDDAFKKQAKDTGEAVAAQKALYEAQQRGLNKFLENEHRYNREKIALKKKTAEEGKKETEREAAEELEATRAVNEAVGRERAATQALALSSRIAVISQEGDALTQQHELGLISEREYAVKMIAIYKQEQDAKQRFSKIQIAQETDPDKKLKLQKQLTDETVRYNHELSKMEGTLKKTESSWKQYFGQMKTQTKDLSTQIRQNLQGSVTQFTKSFGDSMAKCVVENKSLGQAVRQEAGQMLESMISMLVQWLEKWIITHTLARVIGTTSDKAGQASAATLAGANMVASWAAAPFPIDAMAPAMGAQAFAAAMAFEHGGEVPGMGNGDTVPAMLTPGETVVTKQLTEQVKNSTGSGKSTSVHVHVNAVDASGFEGLITKHSGMLQKHISAAVRKANR